MMKIGRQTRLVRIVPLAILIAIGGWGDPALAQKTEKVNPAFAAPVVDESLPNVLLIGDSISIGYMLATREELKGEANVYRPATNCGPTTQGLSHLDQWLGDTQWDVIHFNFGLHDLKYMNAKGDLAEPNADGVRQQVPLDEYAENLRQIATRLKQTGAVVIWRETTPVPEGSAGRIAGDAVRYNEVARKVIESVGGIQVDPMHAFATQNAALQIPANVHYTNQGSKVLAKHVAAIIRNSLAKP
ncbi:SGNH/GDSL hydrolase family protein [Rubripirellula amarantea]|nr:SGNH/GDSL hydrolase family protein [Rubripirellula amarantea]